MTDRPDYLERGEKARLFPVLADTSKEGRTTSIVLACLAHVQEFGRAMLATVGQRVGTRAQVACYTEICFKKGEKPKGDRPDGLIVLKIGGREWKALVEAKVGNNDLEQGQVERYLELARQNEIDAVITISNQFASTPTEHPISVTRRAAAKVELYHWSWMHVLTQAALLLQNDEVVDGDQAAILLELSRFLSHDSAGVKGFDSMPASWSELVQAVANGVAITPRTASAKEVVEAWHQEARDLSLILSRKIGVHVTTRLPRAHRTDSQARLKADLELLSKENIIQAAWDIKDAAGPLECCIDVKTKTIISSMKVRAPSDRVKANSRLKWLLRQLHNISAEEMFVRLHWTGPGSFTQHPLAELRENPDLVLRDRLNAQLHTLEVCLVRGLARRFGQRKNFITDVEALVPEFYERAGQRLKPWQASAPKIRESSTTVEEVEHEAEGEALSHPSPGSE
ncbi:hypothetical protein [Amorphus orientalis]|uniref:Stress response protein n=1 Tax=Amorphus orientalis TaxID=649198 RepID=A0AAE4AS15_9HYPH|nr:hypothetical protein [Amorphus orientalis]MDQ0314505.1 hypothetical protein [Amorphus orientalis]